MPFRKSSKKNSQAHSTSPGEQVTSKTTSRDATTRSPPEGTGSGVRDSLHPQSSGDYSTNPTTEGRYGTNIGTGVYDSDVINKARTTYTISASDFKRTAPNSGQGIHARQYFDSATKTTPSGHITYPRDASGVKQDTDPAVHTRFMESESYDGGHYKKASSHSGFKGREREPKDPRLHKQDIQQERGMALSAEKEKVAHERTDSCTQDLQRDTGLARHDNGVSGFGSKRKDRLPASSTENTQSGGTTHGRERLARQQDLEADSHAPRTAMKEPTSTTEAPRGVSTGTAGPTAYTAGTETNSGTGVAGVGSGTHGAETGPRIPHDKSNRTTKMDSTGDQVQRHGTEPRRESVHPKGKPSTMDKIIGNAEVVIGKRTGNASMLAKGEAKAAGLSKN